MWFLFKSKKTLDRENDDLKKEIEIQAIKNTTIEKIQESTSAIKQLNHLVEKHGVSGVLYFSTGGKKK